MAIDEMDKAKPEDLDALHMVLEQGYAPLHKAGINTTIYTQPSIIASANPKDNSALVEMMPVRQQTKIQYTLLDRFALIWQVKNHIDKDIDKARNRHIRAVKDPERPEGKRPLSMDMMRKYWYYAQEINPTLDDRNRTAVLTAEMVASCLGKRIL